MWLHVSLRHASPGHSCCFAAQTTFQLTSNSFTDLNCISAGNAATTLVRISSFDFVISCHFAEDVPSARVAPCTKETIHDYNQRLCLQQMRPFFSCVRTVLVLVTLLIYWQQTRRTAVLLCCCCRVYLKARKGFIKYALEFGYTIVPVYCFGECDTYHNLQGLWRLRLWLNSLKMPGVCFWGTWWCPLLPIPSNINTVFGKPFRVPQIDHPTPEDINKWHALYVQELKALYDRHKHQFASNPNQELEVW
eukprot:TRINITY_DN325_c0_g3_i7.p1 TRINITY_DN325_c0_g3~~TRINITY_DN325_c0_g3_i7.p1  ORF type:complete len:249 (-),score=14.02 TRINITY_DN325_c0_g3_i7:234-980(-)